MNPSSAGTVVGPTCPWCGGQDRRPAVVLAPNRCVAKCAHCGAGALSPPPGASELAAAYAENYYGAGNRRFLPAVEALVGMFHRHRARAIARRVDRAPRATAPRRVLEVGCGRGLLLAEFRRLGWEVEGVEVSDVAAVHARDKLGIEVVVGDFSTLPHTEDSLDCIVFWHVLEHLREPALALRRAHRLLRPGALLVVAVPNLGSWQARFGGPDWFHLDPPRHLHHLCARELERWLVSQQYAIEETCHLSWEQNPYGWLQTLENRLGLPHSHLYEKLKGKTARSSPASGRSMLATLLAFALLPVLAPMSLFLAVLEGLAGRGGTVEIYARRLALAPSPSAEPGKAPSTG